VKPDINKYKFTTSHNCLSLLPVKLDTFPEKRMMDDMFTLSSLLW